MSFLKTRRSFIGETSCASVGSITALSTLVNLKLSNQAAAAGLTAGNDCKTLVCILLSGGCDTFNLLARNDNAGYTEYAAARTNLAMEQNLRAGQDGADANGKGGLIPLNFSKPGEPNRYGLHPECNDIAEMFNGTGPYAQIGKRLSFIANIGTLVQPTTLEQAKNGSVPLPASLFSHSDQQAHWQTSIPQGVGEVTGWGGRMADVIHSNLNTQATAMSISLDGNNIFQVGNNTTQFAITGNGALLPSGTLTGLGSERARKNTAVKGLWEENYRNLLRDAFAQTGSDSIEAQVAFDEEFSDVNLPTNIANLFPNSKLGRELMAAAKTISIRNRLGLRRSTIFVNRGGWDHHGELPRNHANLLSDLAPAMSAFQQALEFYNVENDVITFTASDFGRTLRSNGQGTDHAWGGCQMVFGGPVEGGQIFGEFPSLALDGDDDVGNGGRFLPTTSTDKLFEELVTWFGVSSGDMEYVLPNIANFSSAPDIGFISS